LSFETKRIYERLISVLHTPIKINDFHTLDFEKYQYLGESRGELFDIIKRYPEQDIRNFVDYEKRTIIRKNLVTLENSRKIIKIKEFCYKANIDKTFEKVETKKVENV